MLRCINMHQGDVIVMPEQVDHGLAFILAQQAVIDEHASELRADRLMDEHRGDGRIDAAGKTADHPARLADLGADFSIASSRNARIVQSPVRPATLRTKLPGSIWRRRAYAPLQGGTSGRNTGASRPGSANGALADVPATTKPSSIAVMHSPVAHPDRMARADGPGRVERLLAALTSSPARPEQWWPPSMVPPS